MNQHELAGTSMHQIGGGCGPRFGSCLKYARWPLWPLVEGCGKVRAPSVPHQEVADFRILPIRYRPHTL